jgi:hypothetical protein
MQAASTSGALALSKKLFAFSLGCVGAAFSAGGLVYFAGAIARATGYTPNSALLFIAMLFLGFLGYCLYCIGIHERKRETVQAKEDDYWDEQGAWAYKHHLECTSDDPPIEVVMDRNAARKREAKKQAALVKELRDIPWYEDI